MTERRSKYVADFETTTLEDDCRVWGYGIMNIFNHRTYKIGNSIDEFMMILENVKADIYFHNLKFDGSFIINWLYRNGYEYSDERQPGTFNTVISEMGQWYSIQIVYGKNSKGRPVHTTIYDSLKKIPLKVRDVAKAFNLATLKGDIDYHEHREINHQITRDEYDYIYNDIYIMAQALKTQMLNGLNRMTVGSDALHHFKKLYGKEFEMYFPVLSDVIDNDIRKAYRGGFTWLNERYQEKECGDGIVFDVNSLYPYIMYDRELPYGIPLYFEGEYTEDVEYPLYIQHVRANFSVKENHIPTIQIKNHLLFKGNEYLKDSSGMVVDLYLTNVDLELLKKHYDIDYIEFCSGWKFKQQKGFFKEYIDHWMTIKENSEGGQKTLAKLMLNSLYGKFATNPNVTPKIPRFDGEKIHLVLGDDETRDSVYTAMGVFITSYAREYTISTAQQCYDRIIYCDTDSIHLNGSDIPEAIEHLIDSNKLGYWKHEGTYEKAKYLRQKTYFHKNMKVVKNGEIKIFDEIKCAGMTDEIKKKVTFENFKVGFSSFGRLLPKQVPGGVVLVDTEFTIL